MNSQLYVQLHCAVCDFQLSENCQVDLEVNNPHYDSIANCVSGAHVIGTGSAQCASRGPILVTECPTLAWNTCICCATPVVGIECSRLTFCALVRSFIVSKMTLGTRRTCTLPTLCREIPNGARSTLA